MCGDNDILFSPDNVVYALYHGSKFEDSDARFYWKRSRVSGMVDQGPKVYILMIQAKGSFEINEDNIRNLALLSDKYLINALQKDIRV